MEEIINNWLLKKDVQYAVFDIGEDKHWHFINVTKQTQLCTCLICHRKTKKQISFFVFVGVLEKDITYYQSDWDTNEPIENLDKQFEEYFSHLI